MKLLPIIPGCQALVFNTQYSPMDGREVTVVNECPIPSPGYFAINHINNKWWTITGNVPPFPPNCFGPWKIAEISLMRIDGYQEDSFIEAEKIHVSNTIKILDNQIQFSYDA